MNPRGPRAITLIFGSGRMRSAGIASANGGSDSNMSLKQAYVTLRTPVGNGIDWKVGVFDTVVGYESADSANDPNYTRSWGWAVEPTEHTGILATYKINDMFTVSAGIANTLMAGINQRAYDYTGSSRTRTYRHIYNTYNAPYTTGGYSTGGGLIGYVFSPYNTNYPVYAPVVYHTPVFHPGQTINHNVVNGPYTSNYSGNSSSRDWNKTFMGSVTFTAPSNWGWAAGSSIYAGIVWGFNGSGNNGSYGNNGYYANGNQVNYYLGATLNTPLKQLTVGVALDYVHNLGGGAQNAAYSSYYTYNNVSGVNTYSYTADTRSSHLDVFVAGLYATYKPTDKLSLNLRGEWIHGMLTRDETRVNYTYTYNNVTEAGSHTLSSVGSSHTYTDDGYEVTATVEYDLWANCITRLEGRWDGLNENINSSLASVDHKSSLGFYANVIYKF